MANYLIKESTLKSIANDVRTMQGSTASMTASEMATQLGAVKNGVGNKIDTQTDLISQIKSALEGKAAGGGGTEIETCTVSVVATNGVITCRIYYTTLINGEIKGQFMYTDIDSENPLNIDNVVVNSTFGIKQVSNAYIMSIQANNMETTFQPNGVSSTNGIYVDVSSYTDNGSVNGCLFINPLGTGVTTIRYLVD